jgi:hypothetical protein
MSHQFLSVLNVRKYFSVLLCYSFLLTYLAPLAIADARRSSIATAQTQGIGVGPTSGAPEGILPNLDEVKPRQLPQPRAPQAIPSTVRSRRSPLAPRTARHVGDPLPSRSPSPLPSPSILPSKILCY